MIQPINESEKNRIRNLHKKHFILNEETENKDMGIDFWLEELSEFAIHLENGVYDEHDELSFDDLTEYDIGEIQRILEDAMEDKTLNDNERTLVFEYGQGIIDSIGPTSFLNEDGGEGNDHFLRKKTVVDYDAKPPMEWEKCSADIKNHDGPVLLMFSRPWCGACKKIKKIIDKSEDFQKWAYDNNVVGLYLDCHTQMGDEEDTQKCRVKKCSDGKTFHDDLVDTTTKFGGEIGTGMASQSGKWQGVPKIFLTDSSFNKKNEIKTDFNMDNFVKSLGESL